MTRDAATDLPVAEFLARAAGDPTDPPREIVKECKLTRAWFVTLDGASMFGKWTTHERYPFLLAKDEAICAQNLHPAIVPLIRKVTTDDGVLLLFERAPGVTLYADENRDRFFALPVAEKLTVWKIILDALAAIVDAGWILVDFYEGNVLYDFTTARVTLFDFEAYEPGDGFTLTRERNYGSARSMAPEEFVRGARIDQRTNVFNLGRFAIQALSGHGENTDWRARFQGNTALADVLARATRPEPAHRHPSVRAFVEEWERARVCAAHDRAAVAFAPGTAEDKNEDFVREESSKRT